jgi:phenylalanine-4-hydroxylase
MHFLERFRARTVEYGLVREFGRIKVVGVRFLSGAVSTQQALQSGSYNRPRLSPTPALHHFLLHDGTLPGMLFVADSLQQLPELLPEVQAELELLLLGLNN